MSFHWTNISGVTRIFLKESSDFETELEPISAFWERTLYWNFNIFIIYLPYVLKFQLVKYFFLLISFP